MNERNETTAACEQVSERMAEAIDGALPAQLAAHVEACDGCRDRVHDAAELADRLREAGGGYVAPIDAEARFLAALDAREASVAPNAASPVVSTSGTLTDAMRAAGPDDADDAVDLPHEAPSETELVAPARAAKVPGVVRGALRVLGRRRRSVGAGLALAAAVAIGAIALRPPSQQGKSSIASAPWAGTLDAVVGSESGGVMQLDEQGAPRPLKKGDRVAAGAHLRTDVRTRARVLLDDGSTLVLDRGADVVLDRGADRTARLLSGALVVDASPASEGIPSAKIVVPGGAMTTAGAKASLSTSIGAARTAVAIARGSVTGVDAAGRTESIGAGEGASIGASGVRVGAAAKLSSAFGWSELGETDLVDPKTKATGSFDVPGLGELRARAPGSKDDGDKPLRLAKQTVTVRIAGEIARTEIEETFANDEPQILEGIFRFPLPPDAQIERLALDVDGRLQEGSFVEKDKGQKIWTGVTYKAAPHPITPAPGVEYQWVPGPWHDPALLEWKSGGRMELKIYPIPARGSRRVVLAYTQRIAPAAGVRRYVYPLPHFAAAAKGAAIDDFALDVQVMGQDPARGVRVEGYDLDASDLSAAKATARLARKGFVPAGDVVVEFARADEGATATTYAYVPPTGGDAFVAMSLAPVLPRLPDDAARTQVIVVDTSRSMIGERYARASAVVARVVEEMDPRDRFALLACDVSCAPMAMTPQKPGKDGAERARRFLAGVTPDGASDLVGMVQAASAFARGDQSGRALRVIYVGDGGAALGARTPAAIEAGVRLALGADAALTAVSVGLDVDGKSLDAMARGGGGVVVPYVAGETLGSVALDVLEATYGVALKDAVLRLPSGLEQPAPSRLGALRAGEQPLVVARMRGEDVTGTATLEGTIGGKAWSTSFPIAVHASRDAGNAFVPRMFAATTIADLERLPPSAESKQSIVALSKTYAVPSVYTSLIVLESEAMSKAFGVDKQAPIALWTGNEVATGTTTGLPRADEDAMQLGGLGSLGGGAARAKKAGGAFDDGDPWASGADASKDASGAARPTPVPTTMAPMPAKKPSAQAMPKAAPWDEGGFGGGGGGSGYWRPMRREWYRTVTFGSDVLPPPDLEAKILAAKTASLASPDSRDRLADVLGLLARRDDLTEADQVLAKWIGRDPLDPKGLLARADLTAREGDRAAALRIETGALDVHPDAFDVADALATVATRAGDARLSCALRAVHAEVRPKDVDAVARRVGCLGAEGDGDGVRTLLAALDPSVRPAVEARVASVGVEAPAAATGDLVVDATWSGPTPTDVDVALIDPKGSRLAWTSLGAVRSSDATSTSHEALALPFAQGGSYAVEVTRARLDDDGKVAPVTGTVTVRLLGQARSFPFRLDGARATLGRVNIAWASRLVPM